MKISSFRVLTQCDNTPRRPTPLYQLRSERPVVFLISDHGHYIHFFTDTQNTTERVEEKNKRTNTDLGQLQAREKGVCDTFVQLSMHSQAMTGVYWNGTSTKPLGMLTHLLTALLPSSHCFFLLTVSFSGQLSQADCSLLPFFVN